MDLETLLADSRYDLPVPAGALDGVDRAARRLRRRRVALLAVPVLVAVPVGLVAAAGGDPSATVQYAGSSASPAPPPLPYQPPGTAMRLNCAAGVTQQEVERDGGFTVVSSFLNGDPVVDCRLVRSQQGEPDVPLTAYEDGHVALTVVPSDWSLPARYHALPAGFHVDLRRVAAETALEDPIDGPDESTDCYSTQAAKDLTRQVLDQVGLPTYTVSALDGTGPADGRSTCAYVIFPSEAGTRVLMGSHQAESKAPSRLRDLLRHDVAERCLALDDAISTVEHDALAAGAEGKGLSIIRRQDEGTASCTRIDLVVSGGPPVVVLRNASSS